MTMQNRLVVLAVAVCSLAMAQTPGSTVTPTLDMTSLAARALVSMGDTARLQHVMEKARRGQAVTVAVIGGSITQGAKATTPEQRYGNLIAAWWRTTFPTATVTFVNAGIGATGSNYGALRARRDLLKHQPDFVVIEYGVNDGLGRPFAETLEGLVRQVVSLPHEPAVLLLFMMHRHGGNAQEWHSKVGAHYGLPMVSYRDALWPEIQDGRLQWTDISPDEVHPNDMGHACAAQFVTSLLDTARSALPDADKLPGRKPVPAPLLTDLFEHTALYEADDLEPTSNQGWTVGGQPPIWRYWTSDKPGSAIEFDIEGTLIYLMFFRLRAAMGRARVTVDGKRDQTLEAWFDQTWGGYRQTVEIARGIEPGTHRVRIELLDEKHPESTGHEFRIMAIGSAGTTPGALRKR